jgi:glycosyltransferase involved in cell wall biosynthesis
VVIPTYNRAPMLVEAIRSVQRQTFRDWEMIVVDDGSTDETPRVIRPYLSGLVYLRQERHGVAAARNSGIQNSCGTYVAFLDSDDLWLPRKLERQLEFLESHPEVGLLYARMWSYSLDSPQKRRLEPRCVARSFEELLNGPNSVTTSTVLIRRDCLEKVGLFNPDLPAVEDHELWLRVARRHAIGFLDEPLAEYRRHGASSTADPVRLYEGYRFPRHGAPAGEV